MTERTAHLQGANLGLCIVIALATAGGAFALLGPGRHHLERATTEAAERLAALEAWRAERARFRPPEPGERAGWEAAWEGLFRRFAPVADEPELLALVSESFRAPSVRQMQIERRPGASEWEAETEERVIRVRSPLDESPLELRAVPLRVTFHASFRDADGILGRLDVGTIPARIESLEIRRDYPGVAVDMELAYFVRSEGAR